MILLIFSEMIENRCETGSFAVHKIHWILDIILIISSSTHTFPKYDKLKVEKQNEESEIHVTGTIKY